MVMKLTFEDDLGQTFTVLFPDTARIESELDIDLALDPMWEKLKVLIVENIEKHYA